MSLSVVFHRMQLNTFDVCTLVGLGGLEIYMYVSITSYSVYVWKVINVMVCDIRFGYSI